MRNGWQVSAEGNIARIMRNITRIVIPLSHGGLGVYGSQGTAAAGNVPGARYPAVSWTDASGNLWLFGGWGYDSAGTSGYLNDLWMYKP
jgi:hypothetical protein